MILGKIALLNTLVLRPAIWGPECDAWASRIYHDNPRDIAAEVAQDVREGRAELVHVERDGMRVGSLVVCKDGSELVVQAAVGRDREALADSYFAEVEKIARARGCRTVRFHTLRPALVQRSIACGYHASEIVMRKTLS